MTDALDSWSRKYYSDCDSEAFLFYVAFGDVALDQPLSPQKYRCGEVPAGFEVTAHDRGRHADVFDILLQGDPWNRLVAEQPDLARSVEQSPGCVVLRGSQKNPKTLDYLRDCAGLMTYLLDNGACAIYDPQMFHWWSPHEWRERIFDPAAPVPTHHVVILYSEEEQSPELIWVHTRGMRKFGRPDLSVRRVGPAYRDAVIDLCNRFIEYQAFGAVIPEGQEVRMPSLPPGGIAHHGGILDDPDFNNVHVEIVWPDAALAG